MQWCVLVKFYRYLNDPRTRIGNDFNKLIAAWPCAKQWISGSIHLWQGIALCSKEQSFWQPQRWSWVPSTCLQIVSPIYISKYFSLTDAADMGVHSANFYLGLMHLEGLKPARRDPELALDYYIKGAARNNAYCYFELSRIYGEGEIVPKDLRL